MSKEIEDVHPHTDECEPDEQALEFAQFKSALKESVQGGYRHDAYDTIALMSEYYFIKCFFAIYNAHNFSKYFPLF